MINNQKRWDVRVNGVTISDQFISILNSGACLNTQHMLFFATLFKKYFGNQRKIFSVDCYFFADFMPNTTCQLPNDLIARDKIQQIQNSLQQEQQKQQNNEIKQQNPKQQAVNNEKQNIQQEAKKEEPEQSIYEAQLIEPDFNFNGKQNEEKNNEQQIKKQEVKSAPKKKNYEVKIVNLSVISYNAQDGPFRMIQMQQTLQNYAKIHGLSQDKNPVYEYDYAFFPINISNSHWISFLVYLQEETIIYQDSLYNFRKSLFDGMKLILAHKQPKQIEWKLFTRSPQQSGTLDCGVFVLYSLFLLYTNGQIIKEDSFNQSKISRVRQNLVNLTIEEIQGTLNASKIIQIINQY